MSEESEQSNEETSNVPEPKFDSEEDFETRVGRWQSADSLRKFVNTSCSDIYYFERNNTLVMNGRFRLDRRDKDEEGNHSIQFRALPVEEK